MTRCSAADVAEMAGWMLGGAGGPWRARHRPWAPAPGLSKSQVTPARALLERPYQRAHEASLGLVAQAAIPRGLRRLLTWFLAEWAREVPDEIHTAGVWRDYVRVDEDRRAEGGSLLGSPRDAEPFRRYLQGSPFETDEDGSFVRPMHAAIARLAGHGGHDGPLRALAPLPFMARFLFRLALSGGDVEWAAATMGIPAQVMPYYTEAALYQLRRRHRVASGGQLVA